MLALEYIANTLLTVLSNFWNAKIMNMSDVKWTIPKGESDRQIEDVQMMFMHKKNILKVYLLLPSPGNKLNNYPPPKERWELRRAVKLSITNLIKRLYCKAPFELNKHMVL